MAVLTLTACNDKDNEKLSAEETTQVIEEGTVGFEISGDSVEEASGVPEDEKAYLLAAFEEFIVAFNEEDIDRYMAKVSKNPRGFDYDEDREVALKTFEQYTIEREFEDVTVVKYKENEAQVFANLTGKWTEEATNAVLESSGRQVTVFVKEDDAWKVTSIYYIGNE